MAGRGREGAVVGPGHSGPAHNNSVFFFYPTLCGIANKKRLLAEGKFCAPVLGCIPADDEEDAIRIANDSAFGLNGSVLTNDADAAYRIGRRIRAGGFGQNGMKMEFGLPFGGFKQSGIGREGGVEGLHAYLETKTMLLDATPSGF